MAGNFDKLRDMLFGERASAKSLKPRTTSVKSLGAKTHDVESKPPSKSACSSTPERDPYFIQVGFDFGTAFCKCVCRDIVLDKAWIHCPPGSDGAEMPFLIPSALCCDGDTIYHVEDVRIGYKDGSLCHVKMALQKIGLKDWQDEALKPFRAASRAVSNTELGAFVEMCAIYLLAGALGNVRDDIAKRFPGHVDGDYVAVNMAVPVADANDPDINGIFERVLRLAWVLSDDLAEHPSISRSKMGSLIDDRSGDAQTESVRDKCFLYPEVSANVQGFIRSRASKHGIYLFSDAGAGTVDQSVFLFARYEGKDHLTYLHADVFPIGSSHIERLAAGFDRNDTSENLERWRVKKEAGENALQLRFARKAIEDSLANGTIKTIASSKQKLISKSQINELRIIFGGGGHCENPYRAAVLQQFDSGYFRSADVEKRRRKGDNFDLGMPIPQDLLLDGDTRRWINRLTVAYGLSFEKSELAEFTLPREVSMPPPEEVWRPERRRVHAPSKDEV